MASKPETPKKHYFRTAPNICRLCADDKDYARSTSIFGEAGKKKNIAELIKNTLSIVLNDEDLSWKVCRKCEKSLKKFDDFKTMALNTQAMMISESFTKRCSKSPLSVEPGKKSRHDDGDVSNSRPRLSSKRLEFDSTNRASSPTELTLDDFGLNNKPVCCIYYFIIKFFYAAMRTLTPRQKPGQLFPSPRL